MSLSDNVYAIIATELKCNPDALTDNSGLGVTEGWDSLAHTQIVLAVENKLDVAFDFDEFDKIITVKEIILSVSNKVE